MFNNLSQNAKQAAILIFLLICLLYSLVQFFTPKTFIAKTNYNKLLIPNSELENQIELTINKTLNLSEYSKEQIYQLRENIVKQTRLTADYKPADVVFGRIDSEYSWWSNYEHFISGVKKDYIPGDSSDSRGILNPLLLLTSEFWSYTIWTNSGFEWTENILEKLRNNSSPPMYPELFSLKLRQSEKTIEAHYDLSAFLARVKPFLARSLEETPKFFGISGYNARDFNLRYLQLKLNESKNIKLDGLDSSVVKNIDYIGTFNNLCYHDKPCNSRTTRLLMFEKIEFQIPAVAEFWLWEKPPTTLEQPADIIFKIHIH